MKKIDISPRKENTRDLIIPDMHITRLDEMYDQFICNINAIKEKFEIADRLHMSGELKAEKDIYRSQIVFIESALDYYLHCLGIYATEQMYQSNWDKTDGYKDLRVPIGKVMFAIMHPENTDWLEETIIAYHASKTYMSPKEIKGQLTFVVGKGFYKRVADKMYYDIYSRENTEDKLTANLQKIFDRRNRVVHQADREHLTGKEYDVSHEEAELFIGVIEEFVNCIHLLLTQSTE